MSPATLPNFLLVGGARCGSTSLYHYLRQHPDVFMPGVKEPSYFLSRVVDLPQSGPGDDFKRNVTNFEDYCGLFREVRGESAVGEGSVENLCLWRSIIPEIRSVLGKPAILIILRNPADRAFSAYTLLTGRGRETLSFEKALEAEEERRRLGWKHLWQYRQSGYYHDQVKAYLDNFDRVKVLLFDDLVSDIPATLSEAFRFLEVDPGFIPKAAAPLAPSGHPRSEALNLLFERRSWVQTLLRRIGHTVMGEDRWVALRGRARSALLRRVRIEPSIRQSLLDGYAPDIRRLEDLIDRDLSGWLADPARTTTS